MNTTHNDQSTALDTPASLRDWARLMESLRLLVMPFLKYFTLHELNQLRFMKSDDDNSIRRFYDRNTVCRDGDGLRSYTKGLFFGAAPLDVLLTSDEAAAWKTLPLGHNLFVQNPYLWGLTEKGEWVLVKIETNDDPIYGWRPWVGQFHFSISDPLTILTTTKDDPRRAYTLLRNAVEDWMEQYERNELAAFDRFKRQMGHNVAASDQLK